MCVIFFYLSSQDRLQRVVRRGLALGVGFPGHKSLSWQGLAVRRT